MAVTTEDIQELVQETITELSSACKITLYDIYGSVDGWYIAEYKVQQKENAQYAKLTPVSDHR